MTTFRSFLRSATVPVSALLGFVVAFALALLLNEAIHRYLWSTGHVMPGKEFLAFVLPFDGALAAALVVLAGAFAAPAHRIRVALILFLVGGLLAWSLVGEFYSPERHREGPVRLWWPIVGTYLGGLSAVFLVSLVSFLHPPPNNALQRTEAGGGPVLHS